ncbi:MAG: acyltransferase family protein [Pseudomonadota bacterium]
MTWLDNSRILAIFAVVFLHVAAIVVTGTEIGSLYWWAGNLYDSALRWCVPVFVMISGALLLDPAKAEDMKTFYAKRASRIVAPLVFWSLVYLAWNAFKTIAAGNQFAPVSLLRGIASGKPHYHMWFLYMIVVLYLFTPFFRMITRSATRGEIATMTSLAFAIAAMNSVVTAIYPSGPSLFVNWFLAYIPYFFLGYLIAITDAAPSRASLWTVLALSIGATAAGCRLLARYQSLDAGLYFYNYLSITVIPMSISVMFLLKAWNKPFISSEAARTLSRLTLGVYLIHPIIFETLSDFVVRPFDYQPALAVPLLTITVYASSLAAAWAIAKTPWMKRTI